MGKSIAYPLEPVNPRSHLWIVNGSGGEHDASPAKGRTLTGESPLLVLPGLACEVGLPESVFLQQLHYWIDRGKGHERGGHRWVFNSYQDWHEQFPFWSVDVIGRLVRKLTDAGLIEVTTRFNALPTDQRRWYRVRYEHPCLSGLIAHSAKSQIGDADSQIAPAKSQNGPAESQIVIGTETTTKTSTENEEPPIGPPVEEKPKRATGVPRVFEITDHLRQQAVGYGVPSDRIAFETDNFLDHHRSKGSTFKDWPAAWRKWMRNSVSFGVRSPAAKPNGAVPPIITDRGEFDPYGTWGKPGSEDHAKRG